MEERHCRYHQEEYVMEFGSGIGDGTIDITVSYDGTWQKRGQTSHNGAGVLIDALTGLVLDYEVLSNTCRLCTIKAAQLDDEKVDRWKAAHQSDGLCELNNSGSAGMMEVMAAEKIWFRSEATFGFRYPTMVSDGDSKSYNHLMSLNVYGDQHSIVKEECVNRIAKHVGVELRKYV